MGLGGGGGIYNKSGLVRVSFSTLAQNHIPFDVDGAAILLDGAASKIELRANIVWGNNKGGSYADLASLAADPPYVSLGGNVVGAGGLNVSISDIFDAADDQVSADPLLGALLTDPVYTFVYPLTVNSTALNVTDCTDALGATVTTDQRGVSRPQDGTCDAGSYERIPTFSSHCTYTVGGNGRNTVTVWWRLADPGITLVTVTVDGRTTKKAMSPTAASTLSIKTAGGATDPTYDMYSGSKRGAMTNHVVEAATCTRS